ncbi:MAG TPA: DPP IV N-terminal domain-containing protein, partial [Longimicrobiales bacterium]|nr:DPP IV N-terminal domain-containing protein [Longimicrobiales bacterium]
MTTRSLLLLAGLAAAMPLAGQEPYAPARLTADDYARAERFLAPGVGPLVTGVVTSPRWLDDGRVWYRVSTDDGSRIVVADPARQRVDRDADSTRLMAAARGDDRVGENEVVAPDGRKVAFVRAHDLWVRELASGRETRLTTDGVADFGYATNNAGWTKSDRPVLLWSPDSRRIATFQHDARGVGDMYLVSTGVGHPTLEAWKYPLPEDSVIFRIHRVVIDLEAPGGPAVIRLRMGPDPHRSTVCDHIVCRGLGWADVEWSEDGTRLAFVSSSRDHREATLRVADAATGEVRTVHTERVPTFYESGHRAQNWRVLAGSNEFLWYSRESDWGHLYLRDLRTGRLKRQVTSGDWNVLQVLRVDPASRDVWLIGNAREPGDPYFTYLYRVSLDGGAPVLLTPDSAYHDVALSPDGRWVVDTYSTPTTPPVTVIRDARTGRVVQALERADAGRLAAAGWRPPVPFTVKARDGVTDLHGLLYRPTRFDPSRKYPIINHIYPGPQSGSVGSRSFQAAWSDRQALAELGFIVVALDAMGTPMRSRSFHEAYYGNMGDNGLPDQVAGMRQLAERHAWIDLDRAGIYGHSGGGYAAARAILAYPDFFRVAVSQAGNHDNRAYEDDWGEKWQGLLVRNPDGTTSYDNQANQLLAENLEGKLLLAHGTMDDNVPPYGTLALVEALIAANQDFDLILFPNRRHGFGNEAYMMRRRWDYFVNHLLGAEPP